MKFPYGTSDFNKIITKGYFYCDRTDRIETLEEAGDSILFLRPRRFGKSLLLSMLANYYDLAKADSFEKLFGKLLIGKNPTDLHNKYFILRWDFSRVNPLGSAEDIKISLYNHINRTIKRFIMYYKDYNFAEIEINREDALDSIASLIDTVSMTDYSIYLLIDEYDNFANEVMMSTGKNKNNYEALVYGDGLLKTLFKVIKSSAGESLIDRTFITGVSPVVMSDITSGYNIAKNIYLKPQLNDLCGFTEKEIEDTFAKFNSVWFDGNLKSVELELVANAKLYAQRNLSKNSTVISQDDETLTISFEYYNSAEVLSFVKGWLPDIKIIDNKPLEDELKELMQRYLQSI